MTLIKSISGIRGTIGGKPGDNLTPLDAVKFAAAFGTMVKNQNTNQKVKIVIGRDARKSGELINHLVVSTLISLGIDVVDLGLSTTPTVEVAVTMEKAHAGIILTASHNPKQWNALKLLNYKGEFISSEDGATVLALSEKENFDFVQIDDLGKIIYDESYMKKHIDSILALPLVDMDSIKKAGFKIVCDCVNSTGGIFVPSLLKALGVQEVKELFCTPNGDFPHNPEPLPENLTEISSVLKRGGYDIGIVVDPDVDRLALICEDGSMFGEEYTLVAVADYVLKHTPGNTVSNMSSTRALRDVTEKHGCAYTASAVGEVNVVEKMKKTNAIIGGEGNGGIIYPPSHYGRDALVGIALFLSHLAQKKIKCSALKASFPNYFISKNKIELTPEINVDAVLNAVENKYKNQPINTEDGVKIEFEKEWVHLRKSNTEPIIRIYSESENEAKADQLAKMIMEDIVAFSKVKV
jgi:phosphomannomutase